MKQLPTPYQGFIHKSRYARYLPDENRREEWHETVGRYFDFFEQHIREKTSYDLAPHRKGLEDAVLNLRAMPSMRALMSAGPALARDNMAGYNCSYLPIADVRSFGEAMRNLLNGTGVGYSVEARYVSQLPIVPASLTQPGFGNVNLIVGDSKGGWVDAFQTLLDLMYDGIIPTWDLSMIRPAGAPLKTFGGRASGPEPLNKLFHFAVELFKGARGRQLTTEEASDLTCKIGEVVVVGGVRRSALICLSDLNDEAMRVYKSGAWWEKHPERALANISFVTDERPDIDTFMAEWGALVASGSGERGIFNREAARRQAAKSLARKPDIEYGTNPCCEIILRPYQTCNLSEVVVRADDNWDTLREKVEVATILGTLQSTLDFFPGLRKEWVTNQQEERLLGVSMTGILDNPMMARRGEELSLSLAELRDHAVTVNAEWATKLGINPSTSITCVKPSGTVSQLVDAASGLHARHSQYYIRRVRQDQKDPLTQYLHTAGVDGEPDVMKPNDTDVFSFPMKAPAGALLRDDLDSIEHLELWKVFQDFWCEHKPSVTVYVKDNDWDRVGDWIWKNYDSVSGVSFLPYDGGTYQQAPYEEISEAQYNELMLVAPDAIDWTEFREMQDDTTGSQELACSAGGCEI